MSIREKKKMTEKWLHRHPWLAPYIAIVVTLSLLIQVAWR